MPPFVGLAQIGGFSNCCWLCCIIKLAILRRDLESCGLGLHDLEDGHPKICCFG